jgi:hypothetical protein
MLKYLGIAVLFLPVLAGCNDSRTVRKVTQSDGKFTVEESTQSAPAEREAYQKEMHKHLDETNKEIARWREKLDQAGAQAKEGLREQLKNLEKQRDIAAERLRELDRASGPAWSEMKEGFRRAYDDLKEAARKAREKFH